MKTAMQELIEYFNNRPEYDKTSEGYEIIQKATELLEKEKEQIIEAHFAGWSDAYDYLESDSNDRARQSEEYYEETYEN
jgi:hypothetical protein